MGVCWDTGSASWVLPLSLPFSLPPSARWSTVRPRRYTDPMATIRLRLAVVILSLAPSLCLAWGYDGHRIVADIASHYLTDEAKAAVKDLLGDQTMAEASVWADPRSRLRHRTTAADRPVG